MRVRHGELSQLELQARESVCRRARDLWSALREAERGGAPGKRARRAAAIASRIDPRLLLHVDIAPDGLRLELEATESSAWPLAELVLSQAPSDIAGTLSLGRSASTLTRALAEVQSAHDVSLSHSSLRAGFTRGHLLELTLGVRGGSATEVEQIAAEMLVRRLLGDRLFESWVGIVHAVPAPRGGALRVLDVHAPRSELGLQELFATVAAAARGVLCGLPAAPYARLPPAEDWTLLEIEPLAAAPGIRKDDLVLASTRTPELLRCFLDGAPCSSRRFSRVGETFVYVSYADRAASAAERVARRAALEARVAERLTGVGAVTGVGLGLGTTYIDCALSDLDVGLARLVPALRELGLPTQSFVHFFDSELAEEWLAIWPGARPVEA